MEGSEDSAVEYVQYKQFPSCKLKLISEFNSIYLFTTHTEIKLIWVI